MEPNKRGLLQLTNEVPLVGLHNQSVSGTSLGTPKRTWQKESLDSPSLIWQVGKLRPGHVHDWSKTSKSEPAHLKTNRSIQKKNKQKTDDLSKFKVSRRYYGSRQIFFFCFFNKDGWFQSISIIPASSDSTHGQFKTTVNPNAISICSERHHTVQSKDVGGRRIFSFLLI